MKKAKSKVRVRAGSLAKRKGKLGELQCVRWLKSIGFETAARGRQFRGSPDSPDVVNTGDVHFEVKTMASVPASVYSYINQARSECGDKIPAVFMRRNNCEALVVVPAKFVKRFKNTLVVASEEIG